MSLSVPCDGDGGRSERCQWQDVDSINNAGPVGVRVHGTLRRDVELAVCSAVGLNTPVDITHTHTRCSFSVIPQSASATQSSLALNQVDLR